MEATFWCNLPKLNFTYKQLVTMVLSAHIGFGKWKPLIGAIYLT